MAEKLKAWAPKNPTLDLIGNGRRTAKVTWRWNCTEKSKDYCKGFEIQFGIWSNKNPGQFAGYRNSESYTFNPPYTVAEINRSHYVLWDLPDDATGVKARIKPISNTHTVNGSEVKYFNDEVWYLTTPQQLSPDAVNPPKPDAPNVEINDDQLTLSVNYNAEDENHKKIAHSIEFEVYEDDSQTIYKRTPFIQLIRDFAETKITVRDGHKYKARCRAHFGSSGKFYGEYSEWSDWSDRSETRPGQPSASALRLEAISSTSIRASWDAIPSAKEYEVEYMADNNYFDMSGNGSSITVPHSPAVLEGLETGHKYYVRFRAVNDAGEGAWSNAESITIGRKPGSPTTWSSKTVGIIGKDITLFWVHNAPDNSTQIKAELELNINGSITTQEIMNSTDEFEKNKTSKYVLNTTQFGADTKIKWRVRTMGVTEEYGDWSIVREITMYVQPVVTLRVNNHRDWHWDPFNFQNDTIYTASGALQGDSDVIGSLLIFIEALTSPPSQKPISYDISITSNSEYDTLDPTGMVAHVMNGQVIYQHQFDINEDLKLAIMPGDIALENGVTYTIKCVVAMDSGLTAEDTEDVLVNWEDTTNYILDAEMGYDNKTYTMMIRPYCLDENDELVEDTTLSVYRRNFDGSFTCLGERLRNSGSMTIIDPHPNLDFARYRIVAISGETGQVDFYDCPAYPVNEYAAIIQWDEQWQEFDGDTSAERPWSGSLLRLPYNMTIEDSHSVKKALVEYQGREAPVAYYGTQKGHTASWSFEEPVTDKEKLYLIRRLAAWRGNVYVREPNGTGYYASVDVSYSTTYNSLKRSIKISVKRVDEGD